ncbi:hypothetical protein [Gryllotalpicola koreensis]|uniref:Helix-turn-helix domain-containing protein n=1 Tax=Gryllotalpicola koreensis TaxID=993086 RepID=A0ABP8A1Y6_9MICO
MATPITDEERERFRELFDQGLARNDIARIMNRSGWTVTQMAKSAGVSFDRSITIAATAARSSDLAEKRSVLAEEMVEAAFQALIEVRKKPYLVGAFGGRDGTWHEQYLESAPVAEIRQALTSAGIAFDKASRIVERDTGELHQAVSFLGRLQEAISAVYEEEHQAVDDVVE